MTISGVDIFARVISKGGLGLYITDDEVDSLTADLLTSTLYLRNSNWGSSQGQSKDQLIYRPNAATAADMIRYVADSSTSLGAVVPDTSWSDVTKTDEAFFLLDNGVHPRYIVDGMNRGMGKCYVENSEPLSIVADAGFQSPLTTFWTESDADGGPATTFSKEATAGSVNVFPGNIRSGRVLNGVAGAGGYIRQRFYVERRSRVHLGALVRASVGTADLALWDVTNNASIGYVSHSGRQWAYLWQDFDVPATCDEVEVRLRGQENSADIYWNACWAMRDTDLRIALSSTWDSEFKVPSLAAARFSANVQGTNNVASALSLDVAEIDPGSYGFQFPREGAATPVLQFHNRLTALARGRAVYIQGRRAYSDFTEFDLTLAQTTSVDLDLIDNMSRVECFKDSRITSRTPDAETKLADAWGELMETRKQFQQRGPADRRTPFRFPRAMN